METLDDVIQKKMSKSLLSFMILVDPEKKYGFDKPLIEAWNALTLEEQRKMYLYLLYRKWRGEGFYGTPYDIITNCHPYPTNWNGRPLINRLIKENKMVRAYYNGSYGIYTLDEARVWQMTDVKPLN
ncbi:MAG: hypothetical protein IJR42_04270 [Paludibacteraceae bacterium]|nr:hypothetical protein [Paludibacteraceae bacterium]